MWYEGVAAPTRQEAILLTELFEGTLQALTAACTTDGRRTPLFRFRDPAVAATRAEKPARAKPVPKHRAPAESRVARKPTIVESITLWSNTLRDLGVGEKFCSYGRPVGTRGVRLGMSEDEVRKREGSEKLIVPGAQVSTEYREGRLWQVSLRKKP